MPATRTHRIVSRALLAVAGIVLLPVFYVGAWLAVSRAEHDGLIRFSTAQRVRPAFAPLLNFSESDLLGSGGLRNLWWSVNPPVLVHGSMPLPTPGVKVCALAPPLSRAASETIRMAIRSARR